MHKSDTKCNETVGKWCKNKHGASKIIDTLDTYHPPTGGMEAIGGEGNHQTSRRASAEREESQKLFLES
jgi:hypothetical protein